MSSDLAAELLQIAHALPAQSRKPTEAMNSVLARIRSATPEQQRAAVSLRDPAGRTALHHAAIAGAAWAVAPLLSLGADPTAQDGQLQTALHLSLKAATDHRKAAAAPTSSSSSSSPSSSASSSSQDCFVECARLIMDHAAAADSLAANTAAPAGEQAAKRARTESDAPATGASADSSSNSAAAAPATIAAAVAPAVPPPPSLMSLGDSFDRLPLHWAVACGDDSIVLSCLDALRATAVPTSSPAAAAPPTPLINAATRSGDTPLHWACADGRVSIVDMLLSAGADPALRNARGETAADLCTQAGREALRATLQQWEQKRAAADAAAAPVASAATISASSLSRNTGSGSMGSGSGGAGAKKKVAIKLKK